MYYFHSSKENNIQTVFAAGVLEKVINSTERRLLTVHLDLAKVVNPHLATVAFPAGEGLFFISAYQFSE